MAGATGAPLLDTKVTARPGTNLPRLVHNALSLPGKPGNQSNTVLALKYYPHNIMSAILVLPSPDQKSLLKMVYNSIDLLAKIYAIFCNHNCRMIDICTVCCVGYKCPGICFL